MSNTSCSAVAPSHGPTPVTRAGVLGHWLVKKNPGLDGQACYGTTVGRSKNLAERELARRLVWPVECA